MSSLTPGTTKRILETRGDRWARLIVHLDVEGELSITGEYGRLAKSAGRRDDTVGMLGGRWLVLDGAGACHKELARWFPDAARFFRWHLNHLRPGCEHQRAAGWESEPINPALPTDTYGVHVEGAAPSWNLWGWIRPEEHPRGLLGRPCPTCGYRYGTEWKREPLPREVLDWFEALPSSNE